MRVPADTVERKFLHTAMDARAHNLDQERLIFDPSPEVDSMLEAIQAIEGQAELLLGLLAQLAESNAAEAECEQAIAGVADSLTTQLRDHERNARGQKALSARGIARALRDPLDAIARGNVSGREIVALSRVFAQVPREALTAPAVAHHLHWLWRYHTRARTFEEAR